MMHALALLQQRIEREKKPRVAVADAGERPVLALLDIAIGDGRRNLDVGICVAFAGDEVTFELPD